MSVDSVTDIASEVMSVSDAGVTFYDSSSHLLPACSNFYILTKGKNKAANSTYGPGWGAKCSARNGQDCNHGEIVGDITPALRCFPNESPLDELKTWLYDPHTLPDGKTYTRSKSLLEQPRFSDAALKEVLFLAIDAIITFHAEIEGLARYAATAPYVLGLEDVVEEADFSYFEMRREHFEEVPRWGLEDDLLRAAVERDLLRETVEEVEGKIWKAREKGG
jgi:hypothetical protein